MKKIHNFLLFIFFLLSITACVIKLDTRQLVDYLVANVVQTMQTNPSALAPLIKQPEPVSGVAPVLNPPADQQNQLASPAVTQVPCYYALLVGETIPDGTLVASGSSFTKTWTLRNTGSCTWNPNYQLVFSSGERMGAPAGVAINVVVPPGGQVSVTVPFRAPSSAGTYSSYWKIRADNGTLFAQVYVKINVPAPTATRRPAATATPIFAITNVLLSGHQDSVLDPCPVDVVVRAAITVNGAGDVETEWDGSTCMPWDKHFLTFTGPGTQTIEDTCFAMAQGPFDITLIVANRTSGGYQTSSLTYTVECVP